MADGEASKELTAKQRKNKKKKEATKRKKQEQSLKVSAVTFVWKCTENVLNLIFFNAYFRSLSKEVRNTMEGKPKKTSR